MRFNELIFSTALTLALLIIFEILNSSLIPEMGFTNFRIPINVLIILYLGFKIDSPYLPLIVLLLQIFHGAFSNEGWALGTLVGIVVSVIMSYTREFFNLSTSLMIIVVTQIFQAVWFGLTCLIYYTKSGHFIFLSNHLKHFLVESLVISILAPFFFFLLDKIWNMKSTDSIRVG